MDAPFIIPTPQPIVFHLEKRPSGDLSKTLYGRLIEGEDLVKMKVISPHQRAVRHGMMIVQVARTPHTSALFLAPLL